MAKKRNLIFGTFSNYEFHKDDGLYKRILAESPGDSIAMVKCFLYISSMSDMRSRMAECTYTQMIHSTGLSRPMISRALDLLEHEDFNLLKRGKKRSSFVLKPFTRNDVKYGYSLVPRLPINELLNRVPNRGVISRLAMVIYLYILTITDNDEPIAKVSYSKLVEKLGIDRKQIKPALCILYESCLLSCIPAKYVGRSSHDSSTSNIYHVRGLDCSRHDHSYAADYLKNRFWPHYHPYAY
ncbi:hypothetical protein C8D85_3637 [Marinomonas communis]|uniref:Helix-turn-helix protein n=1 Tax=Marinomonas communis TaxID=28254 RepID=A0A4V6PXM0_9GAMM|nr:hypothetical protein C8D85_3637 [Marinomonas communis]